ncbi:methyl-accepting chemotaxis protein [Vibrio splendidus]|uniref:methyl-accepting chemotaxis protein n=1 Tax=Vibrio splendidus TaxID=29497 RepID=UPI00148C4501|nr:methyl-accepting chemotaxis protein [Vibrio splendidus]NOJ06906.1 hypothetical protein [Vibrio splendidus]
MSNKLENIISSTGLTVILIMKTSLLDWKNFKKSSTVNNRKPLGCKFNAPIKAALAGVQGLGFAILADEVRHLANRTQQITTKVKEVITSLQHEASNSITTIEDMKAQITTATVEQTLVAGEINQSLADIHDKAPVSG